MADESVEAVNFGRRHITFHCATKVLRLESSLLRAHESKKVERCHFAIARNETQNLLDLQSPGGLRAALNWPRRPSFVCQCSKGRARLKILEPKCRPEFAHCTTNEPCRPP